MHSWRVHEVSKDRSFCILQMVMAMRFEVANRMAFLKIELVVGKLCHKT